MMTAGRSISRVFSIARTTSNRPLPDRQGRARHGCGPPLHYCYIRMMLPPDALHFPLNVQQLRQKAVLLLAVAA